MTSIPERLQRTQWEIEEKDPFVVRLNMGSLVLELQRESLDSKVQITDLLRKALVVARKLGIKEFQLWAESELGGYSKGLAIPEYRNVRGQVRCWNPFNGWIEFRLPAKLAEVVSCYPQGQAVGELESLLTNDKSSIIVMSYPPDQEQMLIELQGAAALKPALIIDPSVLRGIIDSVRNVILNWTLKLEEDGITGENMTFTLKEKHAASSGTYHIGTYIGSMTQSQLQQDTRDSSQSMTVNELDVSKVLSVLDEIKKAVADINLPRETKDELDAEIATAETQAKSPKPKYRIIRESLHTVRNILEGTAGSLIASGLLAKLNCLL